MSDDGGRSLRQPQTTIKRPAAHNYYRGRPNAPSPFEKKSAKQPLHSRAAKVLDITLIIAVLFCLTYSLIVKPDPKIIASSQKYRSTSVYQAEAASSLRSFKDRSKLTFDEVGLIKELQIKFPEIKSASVELPIIGQTPIIRLSIANPEFLLTSNGGRYVIADNGDAVARSDSYADDDQLPVVTDNSGFIFEVGQVVLSSDAVSFINQVIKQCQWANVPIASLSLPSKAQELDLKTTNQAYLVKFYLGGNPLNQIGQFLAARHQFAKNHQNPTKYLDVRVAGKIYYK